MSEPYHYPLRWVVKRFIKLSECPYPRKSSESYMYDVGRQVAKRMKERGVLDQWDWPNVMTRIHKDDYTPEELEALKCGFMSIKGQEK